MNTINYIEIEQPNLWHKKVLNIAKLFIAVISSLALLLGSTTILKSISSCVSKLPDSANIENGVLCWNASTPTNLCQNSFLSANVDINEELSIDQSSDFYISLTKNYLLISVTATSFKIYYPKNLSVPFNRLKLEPIWKAWLPIALVILFLIFINSLLIAWSLLSFLYAPICMLVLLILGRDPDFKSSRIISIYAQMLAALFLSACILLWKYRFISIFALLICFVAHFILAALFSIALACLFVKTIPAKKQINPFQINSETSDQTNSKLKNPFSAR